MKIQELRIGNLVKCKTSNDSAIYSVFQIDGLGLKVRLSHPRHTEFTPIDRIKPIPLTEEVLLKCGFSDKDYKQGYIGIDYKSGAMTFDFVLNKPGVMGNWNKCYTFSLPDYRFVNIDYLHQLQNLFFDLTGEELEVKL